MTEKWTGKRIPVLTDEVAAWMGSLMQADEPMPDAVVPVVVNGVLRDIEIESICDTLRKLVIDARVLEDLAQARCEGNMPGPYCMWARVEGEMKAFKALFAERVEAPITRARAASSD